MHIPQEIRKNLLALDLPPAPSPKRRILKKRKNTK